MTRRPPIPPPPVRWGAQPRTVAQPSARPPVRLTTPGVAVQRMALTLGNVDATIRRSMGIILVRKEGQQQPAPNAQLPSLEAQNTLANLPNNETLYLDGHGAAPDNQGVPETALTFGGLTPEQLADMLVNKGLRTTYAGKIYLNGCNTANDNTSESYASRFQKAMALRQRFVRVKGNAGYSQVQDDGKTRVVPATPQGAAERVTLNQLVGATNVLFQEFTNLDAESKLPTTSHQRMLAIGQRIQEIRADLLRDKPLAEQQRLLTYLGTKPLRPTLAAPLAVTHYEQSAGSYSQVPPAVGRSGQTLRHHVTQAINKYDKRWKVSQSAASTAAVAVLRNLQDHTALFLAVGYYLFAARPRPPVATIQVGAKLRVGSSFYNDLSEEFGSWI
jgi:hypothetical protein